MTLTDYCLQQRLDPTLCLNLLQEWGIVSDLCVELSEVAPSEQDVSIRFFRLNKLDLKLSQWE